MKKFLLIMLTIVLIVSIPVMAFAKETNCDGRGGFSQEYLNGFFSTQSITEGYNSPNGTQKIAVFNITDNGLSTRYSTSEINKMMFLNNPSDHSDMLTNKDSVKRYLETSSYGKLKISGKTFSYSTKVSGAYVSEFVTDIVVAASKGQFGSNFSWKDYDGDNNHIIDNVVLVIPKKQTISNMLPLNQTYDGLQEIAEGVYIDTDDNGTVDYRINTVITIVAPKSSGYLNFVSVTSHEICHSLGMPDIYSSANNPPVNCDGTRTNTIMDHATNQANDLPSAFKYCYGWTNNQIFAVTDKTKLTTRTFTLNSYSNTGDILLIPEDGNASSNNFLMLEYLTNEKNNFQDGVRLWRVKFNTKQSNGKFSDLKHVISFIEKATKEENGDLDYVIYDKMLPAGTVLTESTLPSTRFLKSFTFDSEGGNRVKTYKSGNIYKLEVVSCDETKAVVRVTYGNKTLATTAPAGSVKVSVNKDNASWNNFGTRVFLKSTKNTDEYYELTKSASSNYAISTERIPTGTYDIVVTQNGKASAFNDDFDDEDYSKTSKVKITVTTSGGSATINYYTVNLLSTKAVGHGIVSNSAPLSFYTALTSNTTTVLKGTTISKLYVNSIPTGYKLTKITYSKASSESASPAYSSTSSNWAYAFSAISTPITIVFHVDPISYTIKYNLNGGTFANGLNGSYTSGNYKYYRNPTSQKYMGTADSGYSKYFKVDVPTRAGYKFNGWTVTGMNSNTHYIWVNNQSNTSTATSFANTSTFGKATLFYNLRSTSGTVTFTANWVPAT